MRCTLLLLMLITGCAHYEYDLTQPPANRVHVGGDQSVTAAIEPLKYEMITVESKLVMMIHNPTDRTITLTEAGSYILDAGGRSRAVRGLTLAPGSYGKFIFPPPKPAIRDDGGVRIGFGGGIETAGGFRNNAGLGSGIGYSTGGTETVQNLDDNYYWDWDDESAVKFHFAYTDGTKTFTHDLVLQRVKQ